MNLIIRERFLFVWICSSEILIFFYKFQVFPLSWKNHNVRTSSVDNHRKRHTEKCVQKPPRGSLNVIWTQLWFLQSHASQFTAMIRVRHESKSLPTVFNIFVFMFEWHAVNNSDKSNYSRHTHTHTHTSSSVTSEVRRIEMKNVGGKKMKTITITRTKQEGEGKCDWMNEQKIDKAYFISFLAWYFPTSFLRKQKAAARWDEMKKAFEWRPSLIGKFLFYFF